ncbi:LysE family translocator [Halobacillus locisalis]|uniref:LysE family translocator n=1 Tax=Halobacillus locisalis TaxID=220753 RepID=A0A838CSI5_9BACI|nr:LysE family translocator [Halobacillus locisalis]MBA2175037.1 LysE family translocator [Halobacillus locisalis]
MLAMIVGNIFLGLSIAAPVGPINIEIIKRGLSFGFWPALFVGFGGMSSDLLLMGAMFVGMSAVLSITWVKVLLMCLGAVVLLHSGWSSLRAPQVLEDQSHDQRGGNSRSLRWHSFLKGFIIAGTNPMNLLFWISIYGSVLSGAFQEENIMTSFLLSVLVFIGIGLWNLNLAFTTHFGRLLASPFFLRTVNVVASLVLIGFGVRFGYLGVRLLVGML